MAISKPFGELKALEDRERQLAEADLLYGRLVEATFEAAGNHVSVNHGLGRKYIGGFVVAVRSVLTLATTELRVLHPDQADAPETKVTLTRNATGASPEVTVVVWVF